MNKSVKHKGNFKISIVIPVLNEEYNVRNLGFEIFKSLEQITHEIIFVDDGSSDNTKNEIIKLSKEIINLRLIVHDKRRGQSVAMRSGILSSKFDVIGTIDGDGQNNPQDFVTLIETFKSDNSKFLLVAGERVNRKDKLNKRIASNIAKLIQSCSIEFLGISSNPKISSSPTNASPSCSGFKTPLHISKISHANVRS